MNDYVLIAGIILLITVIGSILYFALINLEKYRYKKMLKKRKHTPQIKTYRQKKREYNKSGRQAYFGNSIDSMECHYSISIRYTSDLYIYIHQKTEVNIYVFNNNESNKRPIIIYTTIDILLYQIQLINVNFII